MPSVLRQRQDRVHRVLHRVDEAGRALRRLLEAAVEPDRAVERGLLIDEQVLQLVAEGLQRVVAGEVLLRPRPAGDGVDDAADELLDAALALGRADLAAEILGDDDVGRLLRPELRDLDVALLEDDLALLVADHRRADLPLDLVERIDAGQREIAREVQTGPGLVGRALRTSDRIEPSVRVCEVCVAGAAGAASRAGPLSMCLLRTRSAVQPACEGGPASATPGSDVTGSRAVGSPASTVVVCRIPSGDRSASEAVAGVPRASAMRDDSAPTQTDLSTQKPQDIDPTSRSVAISG